MKKFFFPLLYISDCATKVKIFTDLDKYFSNKKRAILIRTALSNILLRLIQKLPQKEFQQKLLCEASQ